MVGYDNDDISICIMKSERKGTSCWRDGLIMRSVRYCFNCWFPPILEKSLTKEVKSGRLVKTCVALG